MIVGRRARARAVRRRRRLIPPLDDLGVIHGAFWLLEAIGVGRHEHGRKEEQSALEFAGETEEGTESWDGVDGT